ncbi:MAG: Gfo/Idh/MocA family oxidoreductase [Mogibacterium sp.]|nr:Gfo/Idh/MocA family oxidoreductase [Mogibacterium sp.]
MDKIRIGVMGPAEIAFRRTVPALIASESTEYAGISHASLEEWPGQSAGHAAKCDKFVETYGGRIYDSFTEMLDDESIDAVYIPLPPGAHLKWATLALNKGKHVLVEKPSTTSLEDTQALVSLAKEKGLALHENYAYAFHRQIRALQELLKSGRIGDLRMVRSSFSFPYRGEQDFRYHADKGGGAIIDCGGYPVNLVCRFLGGNIRVTDSFMGSTREHDVDTYGAATLRGDNGVIAQISWGTDNTYRCNIELHGSTGLASADRVFSPPPTMNPVITVRDNSGTEEIFAGSEDQFRSSAEYFCKCISDPEKRETRYAEILKQAELIQSIIDSNK